MREGPGHSGIRSSTEWASFSMLKPYGMPRRSQKVLRRGGVMLKSSTPLRASASLDSSELRDTRPA